ncbi:MAG TPA: hypothetical protein VM012_07865 [Flavitalea sp.]|nr:hypothetical protein [Flavitalea sp.]
MDNRNPINTELHAISPLVAGLPPVCPYKVPDNYFISFPDFIKEAVSGQEPPLSFRGTAAVPFKVLSGYFENFAGNLLKRIHALEAENVNDELKHLSPLLHKAEIENPFKTPAGYFDELADNLVSGMKAIDFVKEELDHPILNDLKNRPVYTVPTRYFDQLPQLILNRIQGKKAKIFQLPTRRSIMQFATAAAVAGLFILGVLFIRQDTPRQVAEVQSSDSVITRNISKISDEAIRNYVENDNVAIIENALISTANVEMDTEDLKDMLADLPDEELKSYLEQHANSEKSVIN